MAYLEERDGRWRAQVRRVGSPSVSRTFATRAAAKRWARDLEDKLARGAELRTFGDALEAYLATDAGRRLVRYERRVLEWWRERLGRRRLADLKRGDFYAARDALPAWRGGVLRPATRNRRVALASAVLTHAQHLDWIVGNPARLRRLAEDNLVEHPVTPAQLAALLSACRASTEPDLHPFVAAALSSGARAGELQRLAWQDVSLADGIAGLLKTKSGKRRPIALRGLALELLQALHAARAPAPGDRVFRGADGRVPFRYWRAWRDAREAAGLPRFRFHDLRHAAASAIAVAGVSQRELMAYLGHSNANTSARYAHLLDRRIGELGDLAAGRLMGGLS